MEVILKEDVNKLGHRGDVVKVADGYGRNYLLPGKLAIEATPANKAVIEQMKASAIRKSASRRRSEPKSLPRSSTSVVLMFERKMGENDHLFGSVTSEDIAHAARGEGLHRRPAQDPAGRAAEDAGRVPRADQAAPRGHRARAGEHQERQARGPRRRACRDRNRRDRGRSISFGLDSEMERRSGRAALVFEETPPPSLLVQSLEQVLGLGVDFCCKVLIPLNDLLKISGISQLRLAK